ncbi:hypothetical protein HYT53_04520 [Candidatus Woesearchaeota archaeon]|nr:hypothetical protein [Candidatus Woesearchaeota archaeon]
MYYRLLIFLTNAGENVDKIKLKFGLKIKEVSEEEATDLYATLEKTDLYRAGKELFMDYHIINSKHKAYYITKRIKISDEIRDEMSKFNEFGKIQRQLIMGYLDPLIIKLRLFKEGYIGYHKYYFFGEKTKSSFTGMTSPNHITRGSKIYELNDLNEIKRLNKFIKKVKDLPKDGQLKIALDNFQQSYDSVSIESAFLNLMIGIESLFSKSTIELSFRLKRNCAIFLGRTKTECLEIYNKMKELYDIRSVLIHGKKFKLEPEQVFILRNYVRKSILGFIEIDRNHDQVLDELDKLGFGDYTKITDN